MKEQGECRSAGTAGPAGEQDLLAELCREPDAGRRAELVAELRRRLPELRADAEGQAVLADLGELAAPVAHHVNNFLNNVLLDIAVLEGELAEEQREGVEEIRRQGRALAQVVRSWQQYRRSTPEPAWRTDAAAAARRATGALAAHPGRLGPILVRPAGEQSVGDGRAVIVELREEPATAVALPAAELERLVRFLTANAVAVSSRGQVVTVRTGSGEGGCVLTVEDEGPTPPAELLQEVFDPEVQVREETTPLELAACHGLVRRRGGTMAAELRSGGGLVIRATLPASAAVT